MTLAIPIPEGMLTPTFENGFWSRVEIPRDVIDGCWLWKGSRRPLGYGIVVTPAKYGKRRTNASRIAWRLMHGPIDSNLVVRHVACRNPPCVNPAHLAIGTHADNSDDRSRDGTARGARSGSRHHATRLTEEKVAEMQRRALAGEPRHAIAREFGVCRQTLLKIQKGELWKHVTRRRQ